MCDGARLDLQHMGVVQEPIELGAGEERVAEQRGPLLERAIGRDPGTTLVALADELVQVLRLVRAHRAEPKVVEHGEVDLREARQALVVGAIAASGAEL